MHLSNIYNEAVDRRTHELSFVGEDRRKMIEMIQGTEEQAFMDQVLSEGIEYLQGIERLA